MRGDGGRARAGACAAGDRARFRRPADAAGLPQCTYAVLPRLHSVFPLRRNPCAPQVEESFAGVMAQVFLPDGKAAKDYIFERKVRERQTGRHGRPAAARGAAGRHAVKARPLHPAHVCDGRCLRSAPPSARRCWTARRCTCATRRRPPRRRRSQSPRRWWTSPPRTLSGARPPRAPSATERGAATAAGGVTRPPPAS